MKSMYEIMLQCIEETANYPRFKDTISKLTNSWAHIIKWYCQPFDQSTSWISTIMNGVAYANKYVIIKPKEKERIINFDANTMFKEAYSIASKDILSGYYNANNAPYIPTSRDELDPRFDIENLFSLDYVYNLMKETLCTDFPGIDKTILKDKKDLKLSLYDQYYYNKKRYSL